MHGINGFDGVWVTRTFDYYLRRERTGKNAKNAIITGIGKGPDNVVWFLLHCIYSIVTVRTNLSQWSMFLTVFHKPVMMV